MANKHKAMVEVQLDKKRNIRFTMNALAEVEDRLGFRLDEIEGKKLSIKQIRALLFCGLMHEDENLTEEMIGDMIDLGNIKYVQEKMSEAFELSQAKN
jgi:hypothetical protein